MDAAPDDAAAVKRAVRARVLAARAGMGRDARRAASQRVCTLLATLPELTSASDLLAFAPLPAEVDIDPFLRNRLSAGVALFLPWVVGPDLAAARVRDLDEDLVPGWRGVREPSPERRDPAGLASLDAAIVPGVAFDARGARLGHGGGHYDRLLGRLAAGVPRIGVAFACQLVDALPVERHDVPVDVVVTEAGIHRPEAAPGPRDR